MKTVLRLAFKLNEEQYQRWQAIKKTANVAKYGRSGIFGTGLGASAVFNFMLEACPTVASDDSPAGQTELAGARGQTKPKRPRQVTLEQAIERTKPPAVVGRRRAKRVAR